MIIRANINCDIQKLAIIIIGTLLESIHGGCLCG